MVTGNARTEKAFHIAFGVDERYIHPMAVTITSIVCNNIGQNIVFHVFTPSVSDESIKRLRALEVMYNVPIHVHLIDRLFHEQFREVSLSKYLALATFTRLLIPAALGHVTDRVLYLDADIICTGDISDLISMDINNLTVCVVGDVDKKTVEAQSRKFDLAYKKYFNAGVLFINIQRWIAEEISKLAIAALLNPVNKLSFADQDALNIVLDGRAVFIDSKWNRQYRLFDQLRKGNEKLDVNEETVFIHFIGVMKPWRQWNPHDSKELFLKYQLLSPWCDDELDGEMDYKEMHNLSRFHFKRKKLFDGMRWLSKYLRRKYF